MSRQYRAAGFALAAAALYALNIPLSKLLLRHIAPTMLAALLYLGAGGGLLCWSLAQRACRRAPRAAPLTRKDMPYTAAMVVLDIAAPILLMLGIARTSAASVSLLSNFEIVSTALIALVLFGEVISRRLWLAIGLVTAASLLLSFEGAGSLRFGSGSLFVLGACACWGLENNCTKMLSGKSSVEIVTVKGCFSGLGSFIIARAAGAALPGFRWVCAALALGFVAYGLSINFYIMAQKDLGAAKTSAYYSAAPFFGAALGCLLLGERPSLLFYAALALLLPATALMLKDSIALQHIHPHTHVHSHMHRHGALVHTHPHAHTHTHLHTHGAQGEVHDHPCPAASDIPEHVHTHA